MRRRVIKTLILSTYPVCCAGFRAMLAGSNVRVVAEADSADEALRLLVRRKPDVALIDVNGPRPSALVLLGRLKEKRPAVSVIMVDHEPSLDVVAQALSRGCSGYLHKRVTRQDLVKAVRSVADGQHVVAPALVGRLAEELAARPAGKGAGSQELTPAEREVLRLMAQGLTNLEIGQRLGYKPGTVKDYVQRTLRKLEASDRTQAAVKAVRLGLMD